MYIALAGSRAVKSAPAWLSFTGAALGPVEPVYRRVVVDLWFRLCYLGWKAAACEVDVDNARTQYDCMGGTRLPSNQAVRGASSIDPPERVRQQASTQGGGATWRSLAV
jgi:hypothetical protein